MSKRHTLIDLKHNGTFDPKASAWKATCKCGWTQSRKTKSAAKQAYGDHLQQQNYQAYLHRCNC